MRAKIARVKSGYPARNIDCIAGALVELTSFLCSPRSVQQLLQEARVELDQALLPLLVCMAVRGPVSVAGLAEQAGRDHTTISRQLSKLESLTLIYTRPGGTDRRVRTVALTAAGAKIAKAIGTARRRLLSTTLADWNENDLAKFALLNRRFADALAVVARKS